jgi:hypothetical protein
MPIRTKYGTLVKSIEWVNERRRELKCVIEFGHGHQEYRYYSFDYLEATGGVQEIVDAAIEKRTD